MCFGHMGSITNGMHGNPSLPVHMGIPRVAEGDGDLGAAFGVIYSRLYRDIR